MTQKIIQNTVFDFQREENTVEKKSECWIFFFSLKVAI